MSLFEEFENEISTPNPTAAVTAFPPPTSRGNSGFEKTPAPVLLEQGYVSTGQLQEEKLPIFILDRVQFQFPGALICLAVSNNMLAVAMEAPPGTLKDKDVRPQRILRIDLGQASAIKEIDVALRQKTDRIRRIFMDHTARHLLISTELGDTYYLFEKWKKAKLLSKFRGVIIESVAWGKPRAGIQDISTGVMLIGSKQGHVFEAEVQPTDEFFKREERYFKQVYSFHEDGLPITGLKYERFPTSQRKYLVLVATPDRLYQFVGNVSEAGGDGGMFGDLFRHYDGNPSFQEISGPLKYSELHFWSPFLQENGYPSTPKTFAWLTGPGIYHGTLVFGNQNVGDAVIDNAMLLPYPSQQKADVAPDTQRLSTDIPMSVAITEFHFVLLYKDRVKAINVLNNEVIYEEEIPLEHGERVLGMVVDSSKNTYWVYTNLALFELLVTEEDRDVWRLYLNKKAFDAALSYAKNDAQKDKILTTQAEFYFSQGRYLLSATYYAQSLTLSFEEVVLKFIGKNERDALKHYLIKKLGTFKRTDITQVTLLCTWLVEIYINKLNELRDEVESATKSLKAALSSSEPGEDDVNELTSRQRRMQEEESIAKDEFRQFLKTYKDRLDHATTLNLIASHGRTDELLYFAELIGDYERVITHWLQERKWAKAIEVLGRQENLDLYYKFSPILVEHVPQDTVNAWIKQPHLNPRNLIPALLKYEMRSGGPDGQNQAIRYLQYVIQKLGNVDPSIHNYLLSLYVKNARYDDEAGLLSFLNAEREDPHYNLQYALRLCSQEGLTQACVYIYSAMGLYEQAVELALKHNDLELAQINADKPEDDDALRKKLWLRIARHVVEEKKDIRQAMEYLKHCELLKIEDILPFFPDFVLIDDFKEEICAALEEYNMHIRDLKAEMDEATKSAESIRLDIRELRNKYAVIPVAKRCDVCDLLLLTRQFYVFPCEHVFHADCLINYVTKDMNPRNSRRVLELQGQITKQITLLRSGSSSGVMTPDNDSGRRSRVDGASKELNAGIKQQLDQLKEELDEMVASECPYCGEIMVRSIDKPFIGDEEMGTVASWAL